MLPVVIRNTRSALAGPTCGTPGGHGGQVTGLVVHAELRHWAGWRSRTFQAAPTNPPLSHRERPPPRWKSPLSRLPAFMVTAATDELDRPVAGSVSVTVTLLRP